VTCTFLLSLDSLYVYFSSLEKNQLSIEHIFLKCVPLINIVGSKSQTLTQQNSQLLFSSTSFAHFVYTFCAMTSYLCTKLTDLACLMFCYNLRTW